MSTQLHINMEEPKNMSEVRHKITELWPNKSYRIWRDQEGLPNIQIDFEGNIGIIHSIGKKYWLEAMGGIAVQLAKLKGTI